jgi:hypothetical protein
MLLATTPGRQRADLYIKRSRFAAVGAGSSDSICGVSLDRETAVTLATELLAWAMGQETKP